MNALNTAALDRRIAEADAHRCTIDGLKLGNCKMWRLADSLYCHYHDLVERRLIEPAIPEAYPFLRRFR